MTNESHDFDMLAVDVIFGDGTRCSLDCADSVYLFQLLLRPTVCLSFGTAESVRLLKETMTLYQNETMSQRSLFLTSRKYHQKDVKSNSAPCDAVVTEPAVSATNLPTQQEEMNKMPELCAHIRRLTENRKMFMEVLELVARLELESLLPFFCTEFGRIFEEEVRQKCNVRLSCVHEGYSIDLFKIDSFRRCVIAAFALDTTSSLVRVEDILQLQQQPLIQGAGITDDRNNMVVSWAQRWSKQLREDRYFFPTTQYVDDLTQSVDPGITVVYDKSCFDEEFATEFARHPFQNPAWEADEAVKKCPVCGGTFASWSTFSFNAVRASHCRCCGRRICTQCTAWELDRSIARLSKPGGPEEGRMRRVCKHCYDKAERLNIHAFLCEIFLRSGLSLTEIALLRSINAQWKGAAELCLSDYRSSLYQNTSCNSVVATHTSRMLANSVNSLSGHPEALLFLFISIDWNNESLLEAAYTAVKTTVMNVTGPSDMRHPGASFWRPHTSHWHMLCTRACGLMLPQFFAVKMLKCLDRAPIDNTTAKSMRIMITQSILLDTVASLDHRVCESLVPLLLDAFDMKSCESFATSVLMEIAKLDQGLALVIYQETLTRSQRDNLSYHTLREHVMIVDKTIRPQKHQWFKNTLAFLNLLRTWDLYTKQLNVADIRREFHERMRDAKLVTADVPVPQKYFTDSCSPVPIAPMLFPFDVSILITHIGINEIIKMNSNLQPLLIPLIDSEGVKHKILFKRENLEKDKVMCIMSRFLQWVLYKQLGHVVLPTYHAIPLTFNSGIIEFVEDGQTVQQVITKYRDHRLLQHLIQLERRQKQERKKQQQQQQEVKDVEGEGHRGSVKQDLKKFFTGVRESFLCSAKFFILTNYIFAIGDRHRDNVMVHPSGAIFHIDYGMLLNSRTLAERVIEGYVRFDKDLEECVLEFMRERDSLSPPFSSMKTQQQQQQQQYENKRQEERQYGQQMSPESEGISAHKGEPSALLSEFLMETADWFLEVRPYAGILYHLLSHVVLRGALDGVSSPEALTTLMQTIFMRDAAEETCKKLFCDRVRRSRGQTWFKDLTHDTQKRTWSMVSRGYNWMRGLTALSRIDPTPAREGATTAETNREDEYERHEPQEEGYHDIYPN
ncbi:phosphatidylinositol kinase [Trypanosoma theileri]|uniref:Phosphatidylinositol kinase n=1 Tax=Trypanosoma theileri TaxID=67003 RepID=A0A1X0NVL8_9TRYP|nr:phosphatidylinositol kinase [Trypanosoma theileri]ORC88259.1 phosphatidylinositol kinase [Trypanosoma theileri]